MVMPSAGRDTRPVARICDTRPLTSEMGMANPTPLEEPLPVGSAMAVLMPMTRPLESSSTPPLFPGLMAASVWMTFLMEDRPVDSSRPRPLMMPWVSVWSRPKGLPMANTRCPTSRSSEEPSATGLSSARRAWGRSSLSTATSRSGSAPTTRAVYVDWSSSVTRTSDAPRMTWKLVTTCPCPSHMKPLPTPAGMRSVSRLHPLARTSRTLITLTTEGVLAWKMRMLRSSSSLSPGALNSSWGGAFITLTGASRVGAATSAYAVGLVMTRASPSAAPTVSLPILCSTACHQGCSVSGCHEVRCLAC
mmetsp:Transcript_13351/g.32631  ORF Transcript_13351/g.32631 Transcript_13351/m.32631 type:complete len:305 (-) Transcript_13351:199-1113(-)